MTVVTVGRTELVCRSPPQVGEAQPATEIPLAAAVFRRQFRGHYKILARVLTEDAALWQERPQTQATQA